MPCNFVMKIFFEIYADSQKHVLYFIGQIYNWYYSYTKINCAF